MQTTAVRHGMWRNLTRMMGGSAKDKWLVGFDLQGNKYTEEPIHDDRKPTRRIVYAEEKLHPSEYTARQRYLPAQLKAWLTHTRSSFPTHEELQADIERQQILRHRVLLIEQRDREEQARQREAQRLSLEQPSAPLQSIPEPLSGSAPTEDKVTASASEGFPPPLTSSSSCPSSTASASASSSSPPPPTPRQTKKQERSTFTAPTPESDPLRRESQRALKKQSAEGAFAKKAEEVGAGLPVRPGEREWKPEGWSPAVGARRG